MRTSAVHYSLALVALALFMPQCGAGAWADVTLTTTMPARVTGEITIRGGELTADVGNAAAWAWRAEGLDIEVTRVTTRLLLTPLGPVALLPTYDNETYASRSADVVITPLADFIAHLHARGDVAFSAVGVTELPIDVGTTPARFSYGMDSDLPFYYHDETPAGHLRVNDDAPSSITFAGPAEVFVSGAQLRVTGDDGSAWVVGLRESRQTISGDSPMLMQQYAFARLRAATAEGRLSGVTEARIVPSGLDLTGSLAAADARGLMTSGRTVYPLQGGPLRLEGAATFHRVDAGPDGHQYALSGSFSDVTFPDSRAFLGDVVAPGAALGALAIVALLLMREGQRVAGVAIAALYTRISPSNVLLNKERSLLIAHIRAHPGLHLRELQRFLQCGWGTLYYHVGVLRRAGLITLRTVGKHTIVGLTGDLQSEATSPLKVRGAARTIYMILLDGAWRTQAELSARTGVSRQLVSYHLHALEREGKVEADTSRRPRRYRAGRASSRDSVTP